MSLFSAQLYPGRALGFLVLGASLHDILTRIKAEPQQFPKIDFMSGTDPLRKIVIGLPRNGLQLHFDGPEQRLRLIEVRDFTKNHIFLKPANDKERDLVRPPSTQGVTAQQPDAAAGPTFRHIYQRFLGPTYDGDYEPNQGSRDGLGTYALSYPGVSFAFPMKESDYSPSKDVVSLIPSTAIPVTMAVFSGDSWAQARDQLWTEVLPSVKTFAPLSKGKDSCPDEVSLVKIHGGGKLQLFRKWTNSCFWIHLGETTPQDLVTELGAPDSKHRNSDQRMYIHKLRTASNTNAPPNDNDLRNDLTDTDQSSSPASDGYYSNDEAIEEDSVANVSNEHWWNYFHLGFDVLVSTPTNPSQPPPSRPLNHGLPEKHIKSFRADRLVVTKVILHGNVPRSYPFNRHRRCRWEIPYLSYKNPNMTINSETHFRDVETSLLEEWKSIYASEEDARQKQRGMVLNRGWGNSPGSSCELLGGWEENGAAATRPGAGKKFEGNEESTTTLYAFPGLIFEVLKNGFVSAVQVF
ncbi:hypothetical protein B0T16DRAFT_402434 [Cercophora newfieldiana]|uniref:Uncharacterized protein n=1 Tax=Cercophora newfieldiana TaxID=92897 RepID=A0AA40CZY9_9PEZI|nr:hypothetical protein B0T16DRAFT_402434 [Cercophora newfieldiana]